MRKDVEQLKHYISLRQYLQQRHWRAHRVSAREEFVGLCPLHPDTRPSFYVNARKNLFYCHGCERGGDLIRLVQLAEHLSFRDTVAYLQQNLGVAAAESQLLEKTALFYQRNCTAIRKRLSICSSAASVTLRSLRNWGWAMLPVAICGDI
jgi:DNA primase